MNLALVCLVVLPCLSNICPLRMLYCKFPVVANALGDGVAVDVLERHGYSLFRHFMFFSMPLLFRTNCKIL